MCPLCRPCLPPRYLHCQGLHACTPVSATARDRNESNGSRAMGCLCTVCVSPRLTRVVCAVSCRAHRSLLCEARCVTALQHCRLQRLLYSRPPAVSPFTFSVGLLGLLCRALVVGRRYPLHTAAACSAVLFTPPHQPNMRREPNSYPAPSHPIPTQQPENNNACQPHIFVSIHPFRRGMHIMHSHGRSKA